MNKCTNKQLYVCMYACMHACMHVRMYVCDVCVYIYVYIYIHMYMYISVCVCWALYCALLPGGALRSPSKADQSARRCKTPVRTSTGLAWVSGFRVWGLGFGVWGLGFGVWGLGFGVWVQGLGVGSFFFLFFWGGSGRTLEATKLNPTMRLRLYAHGPPRRNHVECRR